MFLTRARLNALLDFQWIDIRSDEYLLSQVLKQLEISEDELHQMEDAFSDFKDNPICIFLESINTEELTARFSIYLDGFKYRFNPDEFHLDIGQILESLDN